MATVFIISESGEFITTEDDRFLTVDALLDYPILMTLTESVEYDTTLTESVEYDMVLSESGGGE